MIRVRCPKCRLRFSPAATVYLDTCPECGQPPQVMSSLEDVVDFRLIRLAAFPGADPEPSAVAISVQIRDQPERDHDQ